MGWIFEERKGSGSFTTNPDTYTLQYVAGRHGDEEYVKAYALAGTPAIFKGLFRQGVGAKALGGGMFHLDVKYGTVQPGEAGTYRIQYDTTGGTARVTQAKQHLGDYGRTGEEPPNHGGALNVAADGRPEGTDVVVSAFRWKESHRLPIAVAGWDYSQIVKALTGKVNNAPFRTFPAGEVRFDGAEATFSSDDKLSTEIDINYYFEHEDSAYGVVYDKCQPVDKVGFEYLWFEHAVEEDETTYRKKSPLIAVHRERVLDYANFWLLQLPGT